MPDQGLQQAADSDFQEVTVLPKTIAWVGMPMHIDERERFDLLKRDVFIFDPGADHVDRLPLINGRYTAFVLNFDEILKYENKLKPHKPAELAIRLREYIEKFSAHNTVIHSSLIDEDISNEFQHHGIIFLQKNLQYKNTARMTIYHHTFPMFHQGQRSQRKYVRVYIHPDKQIRVSLALQHSNKDAVTGYLKDLSLNGMGIRFNEPEELDNFSLKDSVQLIVRSRELTINVATCFVTRTDYKSNMIGVNYNLEDETFIAKQDANNITRIVYQSLERAQQKRIKTLDRRAGFSWY